MPLGPSVEHLLPQSLRTFTWRGAELLAFPDRGAIHRIDVRFRNGPCGLVELQVRGGDDVVVPVDFQPTSVCGAGQPSDTLFVVGWSERCGTTVLERWTLVGRPPISSTPDWRGRPRTRWASPRIEKTRLLETSWIAPVSNVAYHQTSARCWLLEDDHRKRVWGVDPVTGRPSSAPLLDASADPTGTLAVATAMRAWRHPSGGFMIWFEKARCVQGRGLHRAPYCLWIHRDRDDDGVSDVIETRTFESLHAEWPPGTWVTGFE